MANNNYEPDDIRMMVIEDAMEIELNTNGLSRTYYLLWELLAEE
jgi:hypothetical protein